MGNPGHGGWGVLVVRTMSCRREYCGGDDEVTNARMEVMAVYKALQRTKDFKISTEIYCNSRYIVKAIRKGWYRNWSLDSEDCTRDDADLWRKIVKLLIKFDDIDFFYIQSGLEIDFRIRGNIWRNYIDMNHGEEENMGCIENIKKRHQEAELLANKRTPE